jgi:multiple sugar transport system substrate-binding protein
MNLSRRGVIGGSLGVAAGAALARPHIARAASTTVTVWWNQGFYAAEDQAFHNLVAAWEKASGNKVDLTLLPGQPLNEKIVSAFTSGRVPDLMYADNAPAQIMPQTAWDGKLIDVTDVVETQKSEYSATALESAQFYNNVDKKRTYYGVPIKGATLNIPTWKSLIEKAGYKVSDMPKTWDEFFNFFEKVQDKLRAQGMRHTYGLGYTLSTTGDDPNNLFVQCLFAHGGSGIVTPDGKLHLEDPKVREAMIKALTQLTTPYKKGYVPPAAINWGDGDNNNAFHSQGVVMTPNDTISISAAKADNKQWYFHDIITSPLPLGNDGKPVPILLGVLLGFIPKGAANVDAAKDFLRYLIQPAHLNLYLKEARARWLPVMPSMVKSDPYWLDESDPHRPVAVRQGVLSPVVTWPYVFNPAFAQVDAEHLWEVAEADVINGMTAEKATDKAFARIKAIFSKYEITQS